MCWGGSHAAVRCQSLLLRSRFSSRFLSRFFAFKAWWLGSKPTGTNQDLHVSCFWSPAHYCSRCHLKEFEWGIHVSGEKGACDHKKREPSPQRDRSRWSSGEDARNTKGKKKWCFRFHLADVQKLLEKGETVPGILPQAAIRGAEEEVKGEKRCQKLVGWYHMTVGQNLRRYLLWNVCNPTVAFLRGFLGVQRDSGVLTRILWASEHPVSTVKTA